MALPTRMLLASLALATLAGCASPNPYENQGQASGGASNTAKYGGLGALAGAVAGAAIDHNHRGKGALIGAAAVGAAAAGYGYYADRQEAELRRQMENTGVEVQRQGDDIKLIMPGNITFATDSADIANSFYKPLNDLANSFKQFDQNSIEIVGYTDSTGSRAHNVELSQRRAQNVRSGRARGPAEHPRCRSRRAHRQQRHRRWSRAESPRRGQSASASRRDWRPRPVATARRPRPAVSAPW